MYWFRLLCRYRHASRYPRSMGSPTSSIYTLTIPETITDLPHQPFLFTIEAVPSNDNFIMLHFPVYKRTIREDMIYNRTYDRKQNTVPTSFFVVSLGSLSVSFYHIVLTDSINMLTSITRHTFLTSFVDTQNISTRFRGTERLSDFLKSRPPNVRKKHRRRNLANMLQVG